MIDFFIRYEFDLAQLLANFNEVKILRGPIRVIAR